MADLTGMLQAAAGNAGEEADEDFANTVLLLHGDGTNGAQNNTFLDSSTNNFTITRNGNTTQGTFSPFSKPDGRWGNYFNGTDSKITTPSDADFGFGTGDFHISCWVYLLSDANRTIFGNASDNLNLYVAASTKYIGLYTGSTNDSTTLAPINQWAFFVVTRTGSTLQVYMNGVSILSISNSTNFATTSYVIGSNVGTSWVNAYISNFKIVKGSPWTPTSNPTAPSTSDANTKLLTCQSNRFIDTNTQVAAKALTPAGGVKVTPFSPFPITTAYDPSVNGGAAYFDGSGDRLTITSGVTDQFDPESGFTLECWVYVVGSSSTQYAFEVRGTTGDWNASTGIVFQLIAWHTNGNCSWQFKNGTPTSIAGTRPPINTWAHLCVGYDGSTTRLWLNGASVGTSAAAYSPPTYSNVAIGSNVSATVPLNGYVGGLRFVKGVDIYGVSNTTIAVPTTPFTAVSGTTLLCNFTNAGILDNTCFNALETVGNAQVDTSVVKYGTGSMKFDGTGDNLTIASNPSVWFGSGAFTIEMWLYPNNAASEQMLVAGSDTGSLFLGMNIDGANRIALGRKGVAVDNQVSYTYSTGAWIHLACVRDSSNNIYFFVDGTQVGSTGTNSNSFTNSTLNIGFEPTQKYFNGFIDDLRISRIARYTTTFTPPDKAFPDFGE